ncbi:MAG: hypothetical protein ACLFWM_10800, partial [Actinomycetota bacterium]
DRSTYYASALRWLVYDDEIERARVANQLFTSSFPDEETLSVARAYGIDYLIVSKRWAYYDSETLDAQSVFSQNALYDVPDVLVTPVP